MKPRTKIPERAEENQKTKPNPPPKEIILKMLLFITIPIIFLTAFIAAVWPFDPTGYAASMADKMHRLDSLETPKIVVVGGSSVAFAIDSAKIEARFGMPVVNLGLHAGLGQAFHTDMLRESVRQGDIIIIAPENYGNPDTLVKDTSLAWSVVESDTRLWNRITRENHKLMLSALPGYFRKGTAAWASNTAKRFIKIKPSCYERYAFNEYGDNVFPRPNLVIDETNLGSYFKAAELSPQMQAYWNEYNDYVLSKGAVLYMSSPPILYEKILIADLQTLQNQLENGLNFPMISQLEDYVKPLEFFFDTGFHLNETGKPLHTEQLISDLSVVLGE